MLTDSNITPLFPTPVWDFEIPTEDVDPALIVEECYRARDADTKGRQVSNQGGWQSKLLHIDKLSDYPNILKMLSCVNSNAMMAFIDYGLKLDRVRPVDTIWININYPGDFNTQHIHPGAVFSGVYYAKTDPLTGPIQFYRNEMEQFIISDVSLRNSEYSEAVAYIETLTGHYKLFPAWLPHSVGDNQSTNDRISIAFNFDRDDQKS